MQRSQILLNVTMKDPFIPTVLQTAGGKQYSISYINKFSCQRDCQCYYTLKEKANFKVKKNKYKDLSATNTTSV